MGETSSGLHLCPGAYRRTGDGTPRTGTEGTSVGRARVGPGGPTKTSGLCHLCSVRPFRCSTRPRRVLGTRSRGVDNFLGTGSQGRRSAAGRGPGRQDWGVKGGRGGRVERVPGRAQLTGRWRGPLVPATVVCDPPKVCSRMSEGYRRCSTLTVTGVKVSTTSHRHQPNLGSRSSGTGTSRWCARYRRGSLHPWPVRGLSPWASDPTLRDVALRTGEDSVSMSRPERVPVVSWESHGWSLPSPRPSARLEQVEVGADRGLGGVGRTRGRVTKYLRASPPTRTAWRSW